MELFYFMLFLKTVCSYFEAEYLYGNINLLTRFSWEHPCVVAMEKPSRHRPPSEIKLMLHPLLEVKICLLRPNTT
jgi:hypothetical protein